VVEAADEVIRGVDTAGLAARLGRRVGEEDAVGRTNRVDMERQRGVLVDALQRKAMALARMARMAGTGGVDAYTEAAASKDGGGSGGGEASVEAFEAVMRELETWVDVGGEGYAELRAIREEGRGRLGGALKITRGRVRAKPTDASLWREEIRLLRRLGWEAWADHEERWMRVRFPKGDPVF
jgi:hypothetical protein